LMNRPSRLIPISLFCLTILLAILRFSRQGEQAVREGGGWADAGLASLADQLQVDLALWRSAPLATGCSKEVHGVMAGDEPQAILGVPAPLFVLGHAAAGSYHAGPERILKEVRAVGALCASTISRAATEGAGSTSEHWALPTNGLYAYSSGVGDDDAPPSSLVEPVVPLTRITRHLSRNIVPFAARLHLASSLLRFLDVFDSWPTFHGGQKRVIFRDFQPGQFGINCAPAYPSSHLEAALADRLVGHLATEDQAAFRAARTARPAIVLVDLEGTRTYGTHRFGADARCGRCMDYYREQRVDGRLCLDGNLTDCTECDERGTKCRGLGRDTHMWALCRIMMLPLLEGDAEANGAGDLLTVLRRCASADRAQRGAEPEREVRAAMAAAVAALPAEGATNLTWLRDACDFRTSTRPGSTAGVYNRKACHASGLRASYAHCRHEEPGPDVVLLGPSASPAPLALHRALVELLPPSSYAGPSDAALANGTDPIAAYRRSGLASMASHVESRLSSVSTACRSAKSATVVADVWTGLSLHEGPDLLRAVRREPRVVLVLPSRLAQLERAYVHASDDRASRDLPLDLARARFRLSRWHSGTTEEYGGDLMASAAFDQMVDRWLSVLGSNNVLVLREAEIAAAADGDTAAVDRLLTFLFSMRRPAGPPRVAVQTTSQWPPDQIDDVGALPSPADRRAIGATFSRLLGTPDPSPFTDAELTLIQSYLQENGEP